MTKNARKFRTWNSKILFQGYEQCIQLKNRIDEILGEAGDVRALPMSVIPTPILYDIAASYEAMYEKLYEQDLLEVGYSKSTNTHH